MVKKLRNHTRFVVFSPGDLVRKLKFPRRFHFQVQFSGFAGQDPYEEAVVDSIVDQFRDYLFETRPFLVSLIGVGRGDKVTVRKLSFCILFLAIILLGNPEKNIIPVRACKTLHPHEKFLESKSFW